MVGPEEDGAREIDRLGTLLDEARRLLREPYVGPDSLSNGLVALSAGELIRFDARTRSWASGLSPADIAALRVRPAVLPVWDVLGLVSADGRERERAAMATSLSSATVRLLVLRAADWVCEVRAAALRRLEQANPALLVGALAVADRVAIEHDRGTELEELLERRLDDDHLHAATDAPDAITRRAAWRRLAARGAITVDELFGRLARDADVVVRSLVADSLPLLGVDDRRALARRLLVDNVGWIARRALGVLIELDGPDVLIPALTARSPALRRAARDWASVRDVDARSVYHRRLAHDPADALALMSLAELADARDAELLHAALVDPHARVRAAALRGLGRIDPRAARAPALESLADERSGRVSRAAAYVLRAGVPGPREADVITRAALDVRRSEGQRFRALLLLRPLRWTHLAVLLESLRRAQDRTVHRRLEQELVAWLRSSVHIGTAPPLDLRKRIEALLVFASPNAQQTIEFILRTTKPARHGSTTPD